MGIPRSAALRAARSRHKILRLFPTILASGGIKAIVLPARSPNLNVYAERWVLSAKQECLSRLILFGEARETIRQSLGAETETVIAASFEEAVARAAEGACAGDTVLLSPACASFDMFRDYADRGERFRSLVESL